MRNKFLQFFALVIFAILAMGGLAAQGQAGPASSRSIYSRDNLVAWCIVPFDSSHRTPRQRSEMLNRLGIRKLAYDWREKNIPEFDEEFRELRNHGIKLQAFWLASRGDSASVDGDAEAVFSFLKRNHLHTELWYMFLPPAGFDTLTQEEKLERAARAVAYIGRRADSLGCTVGLYNHEGWYGEPENQLAIIEKLRMKNLGMVFNFHHAQIQVDRFNSFFPKILPHLLCINIAGIRKNDPAIYPVGSGDSEQNMMRLIATNGYRGPIGIINESTHPDAETGLRMNLDGLAKLIPGLDGK